jgi:hypothetical protein
MIRQRVAVLGAVAICFQVGFPGTSLAMCFWCGTAAEAMAEAAAASAARAAIAEAAVANSARVAIAPELTASVTRGAAGAEAGTAGMSATIGTETRATAGAARGSGSREGTRVGVRVGLHAERETGAEWSGAQRLIHGVRAEDVQASVAQLDQRAVNMIQAGKDHAEFNDFGMALYIKADPEFTDRGFRCRNVWAQVTYPDQSHDLGQTKACRSATGWQLSKQ